VDNSNRGVSFARARSREDKMDLRFVRDQKASNTSAFVLLLVYMNALLVLVGQFGICLVDLRRGGTQSDATVASQVGFTALGFALFGSRFMRWFRSGTFFGHLLLQSSVAVRYQYGGSR
jgi:hypothetical protein